MLVSFPTLLVVDDDPMIARTLQVNLEADGFDVLTAKNGREAWEQLQHRVPALAIVDLLLPDTHGFDLCKRIKSYLDIPIIMLTAVGTEDSVSSGLELFAEDYVVKPFSYRELLARINRVLMRTRQVLPECTLVVGEGVALDFAKHVIHLNGEEVRLTPTETRLLAVLARNRNHVVTSEKLLDEAWPDGDGDTARLWVNIRRLRDKLEPDPAQPRYLLTERGLGYKLAAP